MVSNAQQDIQYIERISKERAEIILMIDSLNTRLTEIDKILNNPLKNNQ